jgi:hypothetical protein
MAQPDRRTTSTLRLPPGRHSACGFTWAYVSGRIVCWWRLLAGIFPHTRSTKLVSRRRIVCGDVAVAADLGGGEEAIYVWLAPCR